MRKKLHFIFLLGIILLPTSNVQSQTIPVTLHFKPDYTAFDTLRLSGTFNGWQNNLHEYNMTDIDGDGEYEVTTNLAIGVVHNYKFVMDANWSLSYTDPDNPDININDNNNSVTGVADPMITYLLPRDINSQGNKFIDTTEVGLPIRAIFAFTPENPLDLNTLTVTIDGVEVVNPQQYYDAVKKEFLYKPNPAINIGDHTVRVQVSSSAGTTIRISTFHRDPDYVVYLVPVDFYYDANNSKVFLTQDITNVSVAGEFNAWNDLLNLLKYNSSKDLWEGTVNIEAGSYQYKMKLNNQFWVNDPDEPKYANTPDGNNLVVVGADSIARINLITPAEQTVYSHDTSSVNFKVLLRPGIKSAGVNQSTIQIKVDGNLVSSNFDADSLFVSASVNFAGEGRHTVLVSFSNMEDVTANELYSYGVYSISTGNLIVDAIYDEPYTYPAGVIEGSCDILSTQVDETVNHDSLQFFVKMREISDRTRIGVIIANPSSSIVSDPIGLDIKTFDWKNNGLMALIGAPGNFYENASKENRIITNRDPLVYSNLLIDINNDAATSNEFIFKISLQLLDSLLSGWTDKRYFYLFSYIAAEDKSGNGYEVTAGNGGVDTDEDPDIYDAAFIRSGFWQKRMLANYIPAGQTLGPNFVRLDGKGRGILTLKAKDISDSLATYGPVITFLTPGVEYFDPQVTIHGEISDTSIHTMIFNFNSVPSSKSVVNGQFIVPVTLKSGDNTAFVSATDSKGFTSISKTLVLTYNPDNSPTVTVSSTVDNKKVTFTATASSPEGLNLIYTWTQDLRNPVVVNLVPSGSTATVEMPSTDGEYYFNVRVRDTKSRTNSARPWVKVENGIVRIPDINEHAAWIDDAIVYEIYPRSFSDQGGFLGVIDKIPYMTELGINTIWFMPIYTGPTIHGYEITNYYGFEEDYGTETEFKQMITQLKSANIKVILDFVVNHTSVQHPFMQNVFQYNEYSPYANFYIWSGQPGNSNFDYLFDWATLPNLNHQNPDVRNYFLKVAEHWVRTYFIDGYRCDVAWGVEQRSSLFWPEWRERLKNIKPEIFLEAEATSSDSTFYQNRFDSANDWDLRNKLLGAIAGTVSINDLNNEVTRYYNPNARPFRFVENHDEVRVASAYDTKRSKLAHSIIFTLNGVPLIYSGGEVGELTNRSMINWNDPDNIKPYFEKLIEIRKQYVHNPQITRLANSEAEKIYTYATLSGENVLVTAANFKDAIIPFTVDLSSLPWDGSSTYYLTNLIEGTVQKISPSQRTSYSLNLNEFETKIFYYGADSVTVDVKDKNNSIVNEFRLYQNYPNPFNPTTKIKYQIPSEEKVSIKVYDILGREVKTLINEVRSAGIHEIEFDASSLASGVYFYQIITGNYSDIKKIVLMK
jgi:cyclomaltodextrinase / maltogenic alpha-amylase / neopullulanase